MAIRIALVLVLVIATTGPSRAGRLPLEDFEYYAESGGQEIEQPPEELFVSDAARGPSLRVEPTEYGFQLICDGYLWSSEGGYYSFYQELQLYSPSGQSIGSAANGVYKPAVHTNAIGFDSTPEDGDYTCVAHNFVEGYYLGQATAFLAASIRWPTSLSVFSDNYLYQSFNNYNRELHYQLRDQAQTALQVTNLSVTESHVINNNGCNIAGFQTGQTTTNSAGQFKDNYFWPNIPGCNANPNCSVTTTQTIKVAGFTVRTNQVVYGCSAVSITPQ